MFYRSNAFDQIEPWPTHTPLPIICLEDVDPKIGSDVDLLRATWTPRLVTDLQPYLRYWIALGQAVCLEPRECPFVLITAQRLDTAMLSSPEWTSFETRLRTLPKRAEWLWVNPKGRTVAKPNRKPLPHHLDWLPVRDVASGDVAVVRVRAIQKKWLRLIPILQPIHRALCTLFRAYMTTGVRTSNWIERIRYHEPQKRILGYTVQPERFRLYDYNGLRSILKTPLSDRDVVEYLTWIQVLTQHHQRSEWMLIHSTSWVHTEELWGFTTRVLDDVDASADAILWVTHPTDQSIVLTCIRTESIRTKLFRLFPILHPLRIALSLQWTVIDRSTVTGLIAVRE